jgi:hypothetical protein
VARRAPSLRVLPERPIACMSEVRAVHIDEEALQSSVQRLRQSAFEADVAGVMKRAVNSVHGVFGANGAGTMFVTESAPARAIAATGDQST